MLTVIAITESRTTWEPPAVQPLDEARWQAWVQRGLARDRRNDAARRKAVQWISIAGLLAAALLWPSLGPYEFALQCLVAAGSVFMMWHALQTRRFGFALLFGALVLLFNPVVPLLHAFGPWQRAAAVASTIPFLLSLVWRDAAKA